MTAVVILENQQTYRDLLEVIGSIKMSIDDILKEITKLSIDDFKILFERIKNIDNRIQERELSEALYKAFTKQ